MPRLWSPDDSITAEKFVSNDVLEAADVPEARIDDVVEDRTEGVAEPESDFVLVSGRQFALADENFFERR